MDTKEYYCRVDTKKSICRGYEGILLSSVYVEIDLEGISLSSEYVEIGIRRNIIVECIRRN